MYKDFHILKHRVIFLIRNGTFNFSIFGPVINIYKRWKTPHSVYLRFMSKHVYKELDQPGYRVPYSVTDEEHQRQQLAALLDIKNSRTYDRPIDKEWAEAAKKLRT